MMLISSNFESKEIMNKAHEVGVVLSLDEDYTIVKYPSGEKKYGTEYVFRNGLLSFTYESLNEMIQQHFRDKDTEQKAQDKALNNKQAGFLKRSLEANKQYKRLLKKQSFLKEIFGEDFVYPPFEKFKKKYGNLIIRRRQP